MATRDFYDLTQLNGQPNEMLDNVISSLRYLPPRAANQLSDLRLVSRKFRDLVTENDYRTFIKTDEQKTHFKLIQDFITCILAGEDIDAAVKLILQLLGEPLANLIYREGVALPPHILEKMSIRHIQMSAFRNLDDESFTFRHLVKHIVKQGPEEVDDLATAILFTRKDVEIHTRDRNYTIELKVMTRAACLALPQTAGINMHCLPAITGGTDYPVIVAVQRYNPDYDGGALVWYDVLFHQHKTPKLWGLPRQSQELDLDNIINTTRDILAYSFIPFEGARRTNILRTAFTDCAL